MAVQFYAVTLRIVRLHDSVFLYASNSTATQLCAKAFISFSQSHLRLGA